MTGIKYFLVRCFVAVPALAQDGQLSKQTDPHHRALYGRAARPDIVARLVGEK